MSLICFNYRSFSGCAFVTYCSRESAEMAQRELHDKFVLPSVSLLLNQLIYINGLAHQIVEIVCVKNERDIVCETERERQLT